MFVLYIDANSLHTGKQNAHDSGAAACLSLRDMYAVQQIASEPALFHLVVNSVCPAIFGHEVVKGAETPLALKRLAECLGLAAGLALALFGGTSKHVDAKDKVAIRGDPHVLVGTSRGVSALEISSLSRSSRACQWVTLAWAKARCYRRSVGWRPVVSMSAATPPPPPA
jgi:DNA helicase MCM8